MPEFQYPYLILRMPRMRHFIARGHITIIDGAIRHIRFYQAKIRMGGHTICDARITRLVPRTIEDLFNPPYFQELVKWMALPYADIATLVKRIEDNLRKESGIVGDFPMNHRIYEVHLEVQNLHPEIWQEYLALDKELKRQQPARWYATKLDPLGRGIQITLLTAYIAGILHAGGQPPRKLSLELLDTIKSGRYK